MVAKITKGSTLVGVLMYNKLKIDEGEGRVIFAHNMLRQSADELGLSVCIRSFEPYLAAASHQMKYPIFHASINPHPDDRLSVPQMGEIAERFMHDMGYGDQPYIVYQHNDIDRSHIHIVSVRVRTDGTKIDSFMEGRRSMTVMREIEKEYGLRPAVKGQEVAPFEKLQKVDYPRGKVKQQVASVVRNLIDRYDFCSTRELNTLLRLYNVSVEELKGDYEGKPYEGLLYGALDDKGERVGTPFKASRIGRDVGVAALKTKCAQAKEKLRKDAERLEPSRQAIRAAMQSANTTGEFAEQVRKAGITAVFYCNDSGRIYGVTFIDHHNKMVLNGSRLSNEKEFSANRFNELFGPIDGPAEPTKRLEIQPGNIPLPDVSPSPTPDDTPSLSQTVEPMDMDGPDDGSDWLETLAALMNNVSHGPSQQEEEFKLPRRRKKKPHKLR